MRDKPLRLQREWLEKGESRIFWLDDEEHIGIRMRAQQANHSSQDQAVDVEENIWDVYVEGMNGSPLFSMYDHILIVFQNSYTVLSHSWWRLNGPGSSEAVRLFFISSAERPKALHWHLSEWLHDAQTDNFQRLVRWAH